MPEIQKYNLKANLYEADKEYDGSTSLVGMSSLTQATYINSTRTQMFTAHLKQFLTLLNPEFPFVFTNAESVVGDYSSAYYEAKHDLSIIKKVAKYGDILEKPYIYHLFVYDKKKNKYSVITRKEVEDELTEDFGFSYNNEVIDGFEEGDVVPKGTTLYKSSSYDESMNYRYGVNATVSYGLNSFTSEDAAEISESFSKKMSCVKTSKIEWGLNDNDKPINLFGKDGEYKPYPDIGEKASGLIGDSRAQYNEQLLYDFKDQNLTTNKDSDRPIYYRGNGFVVDYEIYCNNNDIKEDSFNRQIIKYIKSQRKYYKEILKICTTIMKSGQKYDKTINHMYRRSKEFLDTKENKKWVGDSVFGNIRIRATIAEIKPLKKGHKFTGRYGNKSVVSRVLPDEEMGYTKDGKRVDVKLNILGIINRTTGFIPHELFITFICNRAREQMKEAKTLKEKETILFNIIKDLNQTQYNFMYAQYKQFSKEEKEDYIESCIEKGIYIHQNPVHEDEYIFHKLRKMKEKYDWLKPYKMFIKIDGKEYPMLNDTYLGEMYMIRLKQVDDKQASARNTGSINMKELPERSYKNRTNQALMSDTAIRFGEYESMALLTGLSEEDLMLFHAYYRTSIKGRRDLLKAAFDPTVSLSKIDKSLTSRVAELFHVIFKSLSLEFQFYNEDDIVKEMDDTELIENEYKGETYMMTEYKFYLFKLEQELREKLIKENPGIDDDRLNELMEEYMNAGKKLAQRMIYDKEKVEEQQTSQ